MIETWEALAIAIGAIVPGFLIHIVRAQLVPGQRLEATPAGAVYLLTLSLINYGILSPVLFVLLLYIEPRQEPLVAGLSILFFVLVFPAILGGVSGAAAQKGWSARAFRRLGLSVINPTPRAWDHQFGTGLRKPHFVIVRLADGGTVYGLFGVRSFASSDPDFRDVFLETVFEVDEDENWIPTPNSAGIWLRPDDICSIEFKEGE